MVLILLLLRDQYTYYTMGSKVSSGPLEGVAYCL